VTGDLRRNFRWIAWRLREGSGERVKVMIKYLDGMPPGVLGLQAFDDVEEEDYRDVVVPAVNAAIAEHGKVRLVYVLGPEFDEYEKDAAWEDVKLGVRHPASFERIAIVTDAHWAGPMTRIFSLLWPGQARTFPLAELEAAKRWAADEAS
jgi:hypothetical protein